MTIREKLRAGLVYLDGGTGTLLQGMGLAPGELPELWNLLHPDRITALHRAYYEAGSNIVYTNTFGANPLKYDGKEGRPALSEVVAAAITNARAAANEGEERYVALDIGPLGRMLAPLGDLPFEEAVALFAEIVKAGAKGADLVAIETMNDVYETKAALLAVKENCDLPVIVTNVYDEKGRLMTGATPEAMVAMLEGMGADAVGMNCSLGPAKMVELVPRFIAAASVPVIVKPNAGLPRAQGGGAVYDVGPDGFAASMKKAVEYGARIVGGCCGTTPEFMKALVDATKSLPAVPIKAKSIPVISSGRQAVTFNDTPVLIGERINPTGKKRLAKALREGDIDTVLREGLLQEERGAAVLDVNVGLPGIDERAVLETCVARLQAVCSLPLQLDTGNPTALARAMRVYCGKPLVNSTSGKKESMEAVFPLVKKYGGMVICLTLDEAGIPETAVGRLAVAKKIAMEADRYGIARHDLLFDPLAMAVSAQPDAALVALETIELIRCELGGRCVLGVSNISFGLPGRDIVSAAFLTMALQKGLAAAIINPCSDTIMGAWRAFHVLAGKDERCGAYIDFAAGLRKESAVLPVSEGLEGAIIKGLVRGAAAAAKEALKTGEPLDIIAKEIVPALDVCGRGFEEKTVFLPQLLMSAEAAAAAFEEIKKALPATGGGGPPVVIATVKGDIHDIGKNIVKTLLQNYGFRVIDLGRDVAPQAVADKVLETGAPLVGLSALMTTTVPAMEETIRLLRKTAPSCKIMVGGAVLTKDYAATIGADFYAATAMDSVRYAQQIVK